MACAPVFAERCVAYGFCPFHFCLPGPVVNTHQNRGWLVEIEARRGKNAADNPYLYVALRSDGAEAPSSSSVTERVMTVTGGSACGCLLNDWCRAIRRITISNSILFRRLRGNVFRISGNRFAQRIVQCQQILARSTYPELT